MKVTIYVEGGGHTRSLQGPCREAFRKLFKAMGFEGPALTVVACGDRASTYRDFCTAHRTRKADQFPILLVDSEEAVEGGAWEHLHSQDRWARPAEADDSQAQLMIQCMETWIMADRAALQRAFRHQSLRVNALLPESALESRSPKAVLASLKQFTRDCPQNRQYQKSTHSFQLVGELAPAALEQHLPSFRRLRETLNQKLNQKL